MSVIVNTVSAQLLLSKIREEISNSISSKWEVDSVGDITLKSPDYHKRAWLHDKNAESFGGSVATFLVRGTCYSENLDKVANWLVEELKDADVLNAEDTLDNGVLSTPGLSLYIFYRSRNAGDGSAAKRYSNQFVLIQNKAIMHHGGY